jgi:acyl-CoA thioester hydrolase
MSPENSGSISSENGRVFETKLRVRYAETDQMGVVYHSNYLIWMEVGRVELLRELGFDYKRMEAEQDIGIAVVEARVRYKAPARYDDEVIVKTRVKHVRGAVVQFGYEILRAADGLLLAEGETTHIAVSGKLEKRALPEDCVAALRASMGAAEREQRA